MKPIVAIIGKPNVGKSTLFNHLIGERKSIVEDTPGVTRDRIYGDTEWKGKSFTLIDTGGIEEEATDVIGEQMKLQAQLAIEMADVVVFITDIKTGITSTDKDIALILKKSKKNVILVCNKVDDFKKYENEIYEFYNLGIGEPHPISAANRRGIGDLLDIIYDELPEVENDEDENEIKVAVIGKPNVGKSSLINKILGENRLIVSDIAGTTRDAIDSKFENQYGKYVFIDTAGLRRHSKIEEKIEKYSVLRTDISIERADVCILMIDANDGVTEQDAKIAGKAHEAGRAIIIAINKWDEYEKENGTLEKYQKEVYQKLSYLEYAPIIFISAKTGKRVEKLFELINEVNKNNEMRISTSVLNELLAEAVSMVQPPTDKGRRLKVFYITQVGIKPPAFAVFVNSKKLFHFSYQRYIINKLRQEFGFKGTPIRLLIRERSDKSDN
ncbi:MAG: ribosome biogenesis GTPase Der [Clostridia bacterium]|nr:ribosome biogenesis GTPase Der [Clostridia bacterium]